jgi:uncharacterized protein
MKLAIVSDSHHAVDELDKLLSYLQKNGIKHLAHAGDFMTTKVVSVFEKYPEIQVYISRGNMDFQGNVFKEMRALSHVEIDDVVFFELEEIQFAISHVQGMAQSSAAGKIIDIFIHGHTHQPKIEKTETGMIINPGSLMDGAGFMLMDLPSLEVDRKFNFN